MTRIYIGEIPVDLLTIYEAQTKIHSIILQSTQPHQIVTLNSLMYNFTQSDIEFREAIKNATLVISDSRYINSK